jgi:protein SCO1
VNKTRRNLTTTTAIALLCAFAVYAFWPAAPAAQVGLRSADPTASALPISFPAPEFSFPDQDDTSISTQSLRGKVTIVDFIFTHCASTCPKMTAKRVELQKLLSDRRITFLSISVDPARDDRSTRKSYAKEKNIDESRWRFVSPPDEKAAMTIAQQMKIASNAPHSHDASPILHSDRFVLIDANARVRGAYPITDVGAMQRLIRDAGALASDIAAPATTR